MKFFFLSLSMKFFLEHLKKKKGPPPSTMGPTTSTSTGGGRWLGSTFSFMAVTSTGSPSSFSLLKETSPSEGKFKSIFLENFGTLEDNSSFWFAGINYQRWSNVPYDISFPLLICGNELSKGVFDHLWTIKGCIWPPLIVHSRKSRTGMNYQGV